MIPTKAFIHGNKVIFKLPGKSDTAVVVDAANSIPRWVYTKRELEEKIGELDSEFSFLKAIADSGIFEQ